VFNCFSCVLVATLFTVYTHACSRREGAQCNVPDMRVLALLCHCQSSLPRPPLLGFWRHFAYLKHHGVLPQHCTLERVSSAGDTPWRFHLVLAEDLSFMHAIDNLTELAFYWIVVRSTGALMGSKQVYSCAILCSFLLFSVLPQNMDGRNQQHLMLMLPGGSKGKSLKRYLDS